MDKRNNKKEVAFININTLEYDTVFKTQVLGWIDIYEKYGIKFDFVMFKSIKKMFSKSNSIQDKKKSKIN